MRCAVMPMIYLNRLSAHWEKWNRSLANMDRQKTFDRKLRVAKLLLSPRAIKESKSVFDIFGDGSLCQIDSLSEGIVALRYTRQLFFNRGLIEWVR